MEVQILDEIDGNELYTLNVVVLPEHGRCYGVVNRQWGVIEMSTSVLPNAKKFMGMLDDWSRNPPEGDEPLPELPETFQ